MGQEEKESRDGIGEESCDFCGKATAVVYCRADTARLCLACDRHVHAANSVCSRHGRSLLCDACRAAPAAIFCASSCRSVLCSNCDFDAHRSPGDLARHERRQIEGFSGCPSALELASVLGVGGDEKAVVAGDDVGDYLVEDLAVWETPPVFRLDDLIVPATACHGFQAIGMPPLPKRQNSSCGKHKEDIVQQIRELVELENHEKNESGMTEPALGFHLLENHENNESGMVEPAVELHSQEAAQNLQQMYLGPGVYFDASWTATPTHENIILEVDQNDGHNPTNTFTLVAPGEEYGEYTGSSSAVNSFYTNESTEAQLTASYDSGGDRDHDDGLLRERMQLLPSRSGHELACPDRSSVISRYKEKRKTRRYDKLIRYESRKVRANSRIRIKGRFAKADEIPKL